MSPKTKDTLHKTDLRALASTGGQPGWPAREHRRWSLRIRWSVREREGKKGEFPPPNSRSRRDRPITSLHLFLLNQLSAPSASSSSVSPVPTSSLARANRRRRTRMEEAERRLTESKKERNESVPPPPPLVFLFTTTKPRRRPRPSFRSRRSVPRSPSSCSSKPPGRRPCLYPRAREASPWGLVPARRI